MGLGEMGLGELGLGEMGLGEMGQNRFYQVKLEKYSINITPDKNSKPHNRPMNANRQT